MWEAVAQTLDSQSRGWTQELVFGTLRLQARLDYTLDRHLHKGVASVPGPLLRLLRLGAYQILYMGSVPEYAAVSQTAEEAAALGGKKGAGMVNAVLRAVGRSGPDPDSFPDFEEDPSGYLSTWGSHPRWLVDRWLARFGPDKTRVIVESANRTPRLYLRPVGLGLARATELLSGKGIEVEKGPETSRTLALPAGADPSKVLAAVPGIIQDPAASASIEFAEVQRGEKVADLCAAPGGKGIGLMDRGGWVVALDRSLRRLERMRGALMRLELPARLVVADGSAPPLLPVDRVLVDAPCTGTGTLGRKPDARWRLRPESPVEMARVQLEIMAGAATLVRPGGVLIYATCTLEVEENEGVVSSFLETHDNFAPDEGPGVMQILPGEMGGDGAFAARMRRLE